MHKFFQRLIFICSNPRMAVSNIAVSGVRLSAKASSTLLRLKDAILQIVALGSLLFQHSINFS